MSVSWAYAALRRALCAVALAACLAVLPPGSAAAEGDWVWPLRPRPAVVNGFDPPELDWLPGHRGVDLAGSGGQRVHSAGAGQVTYAGLLAGVGVVVVRHGELRTTYQPVLAGVGVGDQVAAGAVIGRLARQGSHCAPAVCLHWGLVRGETYLDPLTLLGLGPVRLLPQGDAALLTPAVVPRSGPVPSPTPDQPPADGGRGLAIAVGAVAAGAAVAARRSLQGRQARG